MLKSIIPNFSHLPMIWKFIETKSVDCKALQVDTDAVQQWYGGNCVEIDIKETEILSSTCKTNSIRFKYPIKQSYFCSDVGVMSDSKLYFHCQVSFVYSQAIRTFKADLSYFIYCFNYVKTTVCLSHGISLQ
jgi:hypothetical protein